MRNKKPAQYIAIGLISIVIALGAVLFVKPQPLYIPIGWEVRSAGAACACASCTVEQCTGKQQTGSPFLEHYIGGNSQYDNSFAANLNTYLGYYLGLAVICSTALTVTVLRRKRRRL